MDTAFLQSKNMELKSMKDIGNIIKKMVLAFIITKMEANMKVVGKMIKEMVQEHFIIKKDKLFNLVYGHKIKL